MRIEAGVTEQWWLYRIYDRFDGKPVLDCVIADEEKREVTVWQRDKKGKLLRDADNICTITRKCWCKIIKVSVEEHNRE